MNTIPTTFDERRPSYTVLGGNRPKTSESLLNITLILLNRGGKPFKASILQELDKLGFKQIISIEQAHENFELENLSVRFPFIRFLLLKEKLSSGEMINLGMREAETELVLVLWSDMKFANPFMSSRVLDKFLEQGTLCLSAHLLNSKNEHLPCVSVPAFSSKGGLKILQLILEKDGMDTLYPFDYCGLYSRDRFIKLGGYDYTISNPYWQKVDFGFRAKLWGEDIKSSLALKIIYQNEIPHEDISYDASYKRFYLKNLTLRFTGDSCKLPFSRLLSFIIKSATDPVNAIAEWKEAKKWVELNKYRFKYDAKSVIDLWESV